MKNCMKYLVNVLFAGLLLVSCNNKKQITPDAYGNFESDEILVSAEGTGKLLRLEIEEGDIVEEGQVVAVIDTQKLVHKRNQLLAQQNVVRARKLSIEAELQVQLNQKEVVQKEYQRTKKLLAEGAATPQMFDKIEGEYQTLLAKIKAVKSQLQIANAELKVLKEKVLGVDELFKDCVILNPIQGTILELYVEQYELVSVGRPIYKIANLQDVILKAYISGSQLSSIETGDSVKVFIDGPNGGLLTYIGEVSWIASDAEFTPKIIQTREERVNMVYALKARVKNDGRIKLGMPGELKF